MRVIDKSLRRKIRARLYLNAVLPAFEDLLTSSEAARELLAQRSFLLTFQTSSGLKSSLAFNQGCCEYRKVSRKNSNIILHFITEEQLNREFENEGFRIPIPIKGASRTRDIKAFKALSKLLESYLRPSESMLEDPAAHELHVQLQLGIALRAVIELVRHEPLSTTILQEAPNGLAYFSIG